MPCKSCSRRASRASCGCSNSNGSNRGSNSNGNNSGSTLPQSVCVTHPCSTAANIAALESSRCTGENCAPFIPEPTVEELLQQRNYQPCTDENGCTAFFPADCRNDFWPSFSHPRWLCCADLYCSNR